MTTNLSSSETGAGTFGYTTLLSDIGRALPVLRESWTNRVRSRRQGNISRENEKAI